MIINWPFSKTYKYRCPDGSIKTVFRKIDDALPLFISGWSGNVAASIKAQELANADLKAQYASQIDGLLFGIDELNQSLMMTFRGAYIAFAADPCGNSGLLKRQTETILLEQQRLVAIRVQIRGLVALATMSGNNHERVMDAFQRIVDQVGGPVAIAEAAAAEIGSTREAARKWIEGSK